MTSSSSVDALYRCGVKIFVGPGGTLDSRRCIPVFHRWIQTEALGGLLIDVADYTHLSNGPKVVLVGHDGNLSVDDAGGRPGLLYMQKRPDDRRLAGRLLTLVRTVATAGRLLETDEELGTSVSFSGNELEILSNDRLVAPAKGATSQLIRPAVQVVADRLFPDSESDISVEENAGNRLTFIIRNPDAAPPATLIERAS